MDIFSAIHNVDSRALTGESYWPFVAICNMRPLRASRGERYPLILLYQRNLYRAPEYAFLVPSSSFLHTVASYEPPT